MLKTACFLLFDGCLKHAVGVVGIEEGVLQVELYKWTGSSLELCSPFVDSSSTRLITSLAVISNCCILVGNLQKGVAFLYVTEDKGVVKLLARDFGRSDASAVEFLLEGKSLGLVQADSAGHLAVFKYQRHENPGYEPQGIRALPVGRYYLGHKVLAPLCSRLWRDIS